MRTRPALGPLSGVAAAQARDTLEADLEEWVRDCCKVHRVHRFHPHRSDRSQAGFPDDVLVGTRILFRELKRVGQRPTAAQETVLTALAAAGADVAVWTPVDWFTGAIAAQIAAISPRRETPR